MDEEAEALGLRSKHCPQEVRQALSGYPSNHNYRIAPAAGILPNLQLYRRMRAVSRLYTPDMDSLLDIGCCRGAYVLSAARRPTCRRAVGIDLDEKFVQTAEAVRGLLGVQTASFRLMALHECQAALPTLGGPFHTVLNLGTYHYLFWGSHGIPSGYMDHDRILSMLAAVCSNRMIFSGRLEVEWCPTFIRQRAAETRPPAAYTTQEFLARAGKYFDVQPVGHMGRFPLYLMLRRPAGNARV